MTANALPFDKLAAGYDIEFTHSAIGQLQRRRVWQYLQPLLDGYNHPVRILEINCGTGEDALRLAALGHSVIATDASAMMVEEAKKKMIHTNSNPAPDFVVCPFNQLEQMFSGQKFDLVFSNFGGLNCIDADELRELGNSFNRLLNPAGKLFLTLMSDFCLREIIYYGARLQWAKAFRRWKPAAIFSADGVDMPVYYYRPGKIKNLLAVNFRIMAKHPVGLFIPPSYLEKGYANRQPQLQRLCRLEERLAAPWTSRFADHYCLLFNKREEQP